MLLLINTRSPSSPSVFPLLGSHQAPLLLLPLARVFPQSLLSHHLFSPLPRCPFPSTSSSPISSLFSIAESSTPVQSLLLLLPPHRRRSALESSNMGGLWSFLMRFCRGCRRRRFASRMSEGERVAIADPTSGKMVFEPILEEGVFRFDCSGNDRDAAFPSLSFADPKVRDTPIAVHKAPEYVPTFQCVYGQQKVEIKLPSGTSFYGTGEVSGQLERTGKRVRLLSR